MLSLPFKVSFVASNGATTTAKKESMPFEPPYYLHYSSLSRFHYDLLIPSVTCRSYCEIVKYLLFQHYLMTFIEV